MTPEIQALLDVIQQVGLWAIFAWLYISEKRDHAGTRKDKDAEIERVRSAHLSDIREFARIGQSLFSVGSSQHPAVPRDIRDFIPQSNSPLQPLSPNQD